LQSAVPAAQAVSSAPRSETSPGGVRPAQAADPITPHSNHAQPLDRRPVIGPPAGALDAAGRTPFAAFPRLGYDAGMAERAGTKQGRLSKFVWQGLAGLALIVVAMMAIGFLVGIVKWVVSMALFLAAGYVVWRIFKAVVL
jgi:hypothetical protein